MHLNRLNINQYIASKLGLRAGTMDSLGSLVVLVGENGCGKTRMLEAVDWLLRHTRQLGYRNLQNLRERRAQNAQLLGHAEGWDGDRLTLVGAASDVAAYDALIEPLSNFELSTEDGEDVDSTLSAYCELSDVLRNSQPIREHSARLTVGVPRGHVSKDPRLAGAPIIYIEDICLRYIDGRDEEPMGFQSVHGDISRDYHRLQKLLNEFAGVHLDIINGKVCIDRQKIDQVAFSDGQAALLRIAVLVHSRSIENIAVPILLDEPERHLHPSRLIGLIDGLRAYLPQAQLWIATHSLALTAHLAAIEPRGIWFGSNGRFERAGLTQESVVNGLLGGPEGAVQISDFCVRADQFAACSFSADCLRPPETVTYKDGDPQIQQIRDFISVESEDRLTIIDIGAGQGRLLEGLAHSLGEKLAEKVSYYAIEPSEIVMPLCIRQTCQYFEDGALRVFPSAQALTAAVGISADVVVLANVLHEIEINDWISVLRDVHDLLTDSGSLLIVEDTRLPRGELAHANGFLILETDALCDLFAAEPSGNDVKSIRASRAGARLQATAFKKAAVARVTAKTVEIALRTQQKFASLRIRELRKTDQKPDYRLGHEHAFQTQLLANLGLAIEDLNATVA